MKISKLLMLYCYFLRVRKIPIINKDVRNGGTASSFGGIKLCCFICIHTGLQGTGTHIDLLVEAIIIYFRTFVIDV